MVRFMVDEELTGKVIGCAMEVHRELGPGYLEKVYENALMIALGACGMSVGQQVPVPGWASDQFWRTEPSIQTKVSRIQESCQS